MPSPDRTSGEKLFVASLDAIERITRFVCLRHHLALQDAEDFQSFVRVSLIEADYATLRKFEGRSSLTTYLATVITRLFLDYRTMQWGKWRPSALARRRGPTALLLERLLYRDRLAFDDACELLRRHHGVMLPRIEIERLAAELPVRLPRRLESDDQLEHMASAEPSPESEVLNQRSRNDAVDLMTALARAKARFDRRDQLIVAMRFEDGRTALEIADALGVPQRWVYSRIESLLKQLRQALEAAGFSGRQVATILDETGVDIGSPQRWDSENVAARPSVKPGASR